MLYFLIINANTNEAKEMKLVKTWILIIIVSIGILILGNIERSHTLIFIGIIGIVASIVCEIFSLILQFVKLHR